MKMKTVWEIELLANGEYDLAKVKKDTKTGAMQSALAFGSFKTLEEARRRAMLENPAYPIEVYE